MTIATVLLICLIIQPILGEYIALFQQFEEILIILLILGCSYKVLIRKHKISFLKMEWIVLFILTIFLFWGILNGYSAGIQGTKNIILSGLLTIKIYLCYFFCRVCFLHSKVRKKLLLNLYKLIKIVIISYFLITIINIPIKFLNTYGIRWGINTVAIGFVHPSQLDFFIIGITCLLLVLTVILNESKKKLGIYCLLSFIVILFTGRSKAIIFFVIYSLLVILVFKREKITFKQIAVITPLGIYLGYDRIMSELISENGPRGLLLRTASKIAKDYFPQGVGFGGFGSHISRISYSNIYYIYGLSNTYGFTELEPYFVTDSLWAMILGETGIIGTIIYTIILVLFTICFYKLSKNTINFVIGSSLWFYGVMSSFSDTILLGYRGMSIIFITVYIITILNGYSSETILVNS